jgi:hypothetical protein
MVVALLLAGQLARCQAPVPLNQIAEVRALPMELPQELLLAALYLLFFAALVLVGIGSESAF